MSTKLRKRNWHEFVGEEQASLPFDIRGKTVLTQDGEHSKIEFHLNNLKALFSDISEETVIDVYNRAGKNIDTTLQELERIQSERSDSKTKSPQLNKLSRENEQEEKVMESEIKREISGIQQTNHSAIRRLQDGAGSYVSQAVDYLQKCKSTEEAKEVIYQMLNSVVGETVSTYESQIERLQAMFVIAKEAVHVKSNTNRKLEKENTILRKMNEKYYNEKTVLSDLNKKMLRELDDMNNYRTRGSQFGPNRDIY